MRAVVIPRFGTPDVLEVRNVEVRPAGEGEVRIAVAATAVNPTDIATRSGLVAAAYRDFDPPYIAGMDAAGVIESVGPGSASDRFAVGDEVMSIVMPRRPEGGAHAELIVVPTAAVVPKPSTLSIEQAAMLPMNGLTALEALSVLDLGPGATLAITGGSGFLAAFVMTLARRRGIHVIADGRPDERDRIRKHGAAEVVARGPGVEERIRSAAGGGVDAVLDTALIGSSLYPCIVDGGVLACVRTFDGVPPERGILVREVWVRERLLDTDGLTELATLADEGLFDFLIATGRFAPEQAADAHRMIEAGGVRGRPLILF
ncbi:NADP-dependent oxidoreductase [Gordonia terrae]